MNDDLRTLYTWVRGSRERVFGWLETVPAAVLTAERPDFAYGSLRNISVHVADCYRVWVGMRGLGREDCQDRLNPDTIPDLADLRRVYAEVDAVLDDALTHFRDLDSPLIIPDEPHDPLTVTRRWLLLHPITHEFHHKGQMLALGRVLGYPYPPGPDTDLVLPFTDGLT